MCWLTDQLYLCQSQLHSLLPIDDQLSLLPSHATCSVPFCCCCCCCCSRCTGYRPILDAFREFAKCNPAAYTEEAIASAKGLQHGHTSGATNGATNGSV